MLEDLLQNSIKASETIWQNLSAAPKESPQVSADNNNKEA
jgi:hypothetical protein